MKSIVKRRKTSENVQIISLRTRSAVLRANNRLNEEFAGEFVAWIDRRRGATLRRRIIAHSPSLKAVNDALDTLSQRDRALVLLQYAMRVSPDAVDGTHRAAYVEASR